MEFDEQPVYLKRKERETQMMSMNYNNEKLKAMPLNERLITLMILNEADASFYYGIANIVSDRNNDLGLEDFPKEDVSYIHDMQARGSEAIHTYVTLESLYKMEYGNLPEKVETHIKELGEALAHDELVRCGWVFNAKEMIYSGNGESEVLNKIDFGNGYKGVVVNVRGSHPCAYIQFPEIEKVTDYDDIYVSAEVHGGFTFFGTLESFGLKGDWLGWDYAHCSDYTEMGFEQQSWEKKWTTEEVTTEMIKVLKVVKRGDYEIYSESEVAANEN